MGQITTSCGNCCFAEKNEGQQQGCAMGRLPIYQEQNKVVKVKEEESDNFHYEIKTFCSACRNDEWAEENGGDIVELQAKVRDEFKLQMDFVVYGDEDDTIDDYITTAKKIGQQKILPKSVIFCVTSSSIFQTLKNTISEYLDLDAVKVYTHYTLGAEDAESRVNEAIQKCEHNYFTIIKNGEDFPSNLNEKLNYLLNEELRQISLIKQPEYNLHCITVQTRLYDILGGKLSQDVKGVITNIELAAKDENQERMLVEWDKIYPE